MNKKSLCIMSLVIVCLLVILISCASKGPGKVSLDPQSQQFLDYISYIILPAEEKIFREMPPEDRGEFIKDFWARRDPIPSTPLNEYRQVFYSRLAVADKAFARGKPGWKTDRGRIYILLGPPTNVIEKAMGDTPYEAQKFAQANLLERGTLTERPTIIWVYDNYPGYFDGPLRLVFVDYHSTGDYQLNTRESITPFSMVSPTWDPPDLRHYQWVGELEMDEQELGTLGIFDYDAAVDITEEQGLLSVSILIDVPYGQIDYRKSGDKFTCSLMIAAEIKDNQKNMLTGQDEPFSESHSLRHLRSNIENNARIHKQWTLALPVNGKYIYISVLDDVSGKKLRKLLEIK